MNTAALVLSSVLVSTGAALAVVHVTAPWKTQPTTESESADLVAPRLTEKISELAETVARLEQRLDAVSVQRTVQSSDNVPPSADTDRVVKEATGKKKAKSEFTVTAVVDLLRSPKSSWDEKTARFKSLSKEQQKQVLAAFEKFAKDNPYNADAQNELGEAYVQKLMNATMAEMMVFGPKAEKAFDRALEIDDHHWSARFNKAMSLAHQPDIFGGRPKAIEHFQILMKQQEAGVPDKKHSATYLFLGNMYSQQGKTEEANKVWQRGLERFPNAKELKAAMGGK